MSKAAAFDLTYLDAYGYLWIAVLRQAIDDATMPINSKESRLERKEAREWLQDDSDAVGSVQWICDLLNVRIETVLTEFKRRLDTGGIKRRRRVVAMTYRKRSHP